ncbi:hypothetical protein ACF0H5_020614 [Mactra antiquata]
MSVRPTLMVLYTNDAVEVRYSDGSRLQVLPCGTSFTYSKPRPESHPSIGMEMITQRCAFVTSAYKDLLLSALDFRNRFAERPYLCEDLLDTDQVVSLYARIKEIAWPKTCTPQNCVKQEDGSISITSVDEFGSLILSPHCRDFTVCYLSLLSEYNKTSNKKDRGMMNDKRCESHQDCSCKTVNKKSNSAKSDIKHESGSNRSDNDGQESIYKFHGRSGSSYITKHSKEKVDLNISPITQASFVDSPRALSNDSHSPASSEEGVIDRDAVYRHFSTPTEGLDEESPSVILQECAIKGRDNNVQRYFQNANNDGSFIGNVFKPISNPQCGQTDNNYDDEKCAINKNDVNVLHVACESSQSGRQDSMLLHRKCAHGDLTSKCDKGGKTRYKYTWLTRHISCDECPINFNTIVKMANNVAKNGIPRSDDLKELDSKQEEKKKGASKLKKINRKYCEMSEVPLPLPLSCPGQHLHKTQSKQSYDDGKNPTEDPSTFSQGRLKVLLIDGVVYRIVRLPTIKVIEIYPGDGSVLTSQGMAAHFFLHIIPHGTEVEERTYSIKSPPPATKGSYSVKNLITRAHRFLGYIRQEESNLPSSVGLCCWKHEEITILEPMSTTVLEECEISGYGKFTALSNGQIRISFTDRTCLDMTWDFSKRLNKTLDQSTLSKAEQTSDGSSILADKKSGTCKLLLPNGHYQMIDIQHPGIYKRYIDVAREWADWVNSSPAQRQIFYREKNQNNMNLSVERELQKIQCFNYIVDNTLMKQSSSGSSTGMNNADQATRPSILRRPDPKGFKSSHTHENIQRTVQIHSPPSMHSRSSGSLVSSTVVDPNTRSDLIGTSYAPSSVPSVRPNPIGQSSVPSQNSLHSSRTSLPSSLEGFNSVREALMRTSNVIKDIDKLLEKK